VESTVIAPEAGGGLRARLRAARDSVRRPLHAALNRIDEPVVILVYHRVAVPSDDPFALSVHPDRFREHLRHLKSHHPILRLEDDLRRAPARSIVITFDDGYADNATTALPALEAERVPATFFVSSGYVDSGKPFWWDEVASVARGDRGRERLESLLESEGGRTPKSSDDVMNLLRRVHLRLKRDDVATRERRLERLREGGAPSPGGALESAPRPLTRGELERLARSPIATLGAHGVDHPSFTALPLPSQRDQMTRSKRELEAWTGVPVHSFSFPFGERGDFTSDSLRLASEVGFRRVAVNIPGQVHRWTSMGRLPRHVVGDWPVPRFEAELEQFWTR
jgi:peptidoglycan/xylan/chitin deacetylase (PgdA/CDA1 family)